MSLFLAVLLVTAMAIPASAQSFVLDREWGGFAYGTADTCYMYDFSCVIEGSTDECTIRTDVEVQLIGETFDGQSNFYYPGTTSTILSANSAHIGYLISYINCYHYIDNSFASMQRVEPG